ncbi:biliverdin-producing heme oxygenase [Litoribacter ruber]|uniref:Biliverdin-producing heme oxygenase n=1 Tax=Litoribacter ruber TaxID=702568 RepID=A0AAP2CG24_9BACT|nr:MULTISPECIES: biliverdin-producing heme oxygenase [Litoribacter]MBS9523382.1 biliverdin-producing heme oxygenase [Litoribacter alkaliphilus]MBT0812492.1 biliverdin-producing heme oxygenase [Litoribacter ruber]
MVTETLKESTKKHHSLTEKALNSKQIFQESFDLEAYIHILKNLYLAHELIEKKLMEQENPEFADLMQRHYLMRKGLLEKDLQNLSADIPSNSNVVFDLENTNQALGALYVLKGSTLGGKFIYKHLHKVSQNWEKTSLEFYGFEHEEVMENWKLFTQELNALPISPDKEKQMVIGAEKAFTTFIEVSEEFSKA